MPSPTRRRKKAAMDPLDEALEAGQKEAAARQQRELQLWQSWNNSGRTPEQLDPLLDQYKPLIKRKAVEYGGGLPMVPRESIEAEITKQVIGAFQSYNPERGASLLTHVHHRIPKAKRFVVQHQNIAYIPDAKAFQIGNIQRAQSALSEDLGRDPTPEELAGHLGMPVKRLVSIQKAMVKDVPSSAFESDPFPQLGPRQQEILSLLPSVLTPEEKQVFDLIFHPTKPVTSTSAIAQRLGKNSSQVSRLKSSIIDKANQYI